jgi:protein-tyrosine phosphatase
MKELLANLKRTMARAIGLNERAAPPSPTARRILFVCMGNICRSPTAEGVFRKLVAEKAPDLEVEIDSAGTHGYHNGASPDPRACRAAERRGIDLKPLRARRVTQEDFVQYELVLAMDEQNREFLLEVCPVEYRHRIKLFLEFAPHLEWREVPDPYYGGATGFEHVLDLVEEAAAGLLEHLRTTPPEPRNAAPAARDPV